MAALAKTRSTMDKLIVLSSLVLLPPAVAADEAPPFGNIYSFLRATSDYRVNGVSSSDRGPAAQASLYWAAPQRFFAGVWYSTVDFNDQGKTSYELDFYGGRNFRLEYFDLIAEIFFYTTPDRSGPGATYDYTEGRLRLQDKFGRVTLRSTVGWSPSYSFGAGETWRIEASAAYSMTEWLAFNAVVGRRWLENRIDRSHWEAGFTAHWKRLSLDLRYVDTTLSRRQCGHVDWCSAAFVGTVTWDLPPAF